MEYRTSFTTAEISFRNGRPVLKGVSGNTSGQSTTNGSTRLKALLDIWANATLLFSNMAFEQALIEYQRLISFRPSDVYQAVIFLNMGLIRCILGENYRGLECFDKATEKCSRLAIGWMLQGITSYMLKRFKDAVFQLETCLACFDPGAEGIDFRLIGLDFVLLRSDVEKNMAISQDAVNRLRFGVTPKPKRVVGLQLIEPLFPPSPPASPSSSLSPSPPQHHGATSDPTSPATWYVSGRGGIRQSFQYGLDGAVDSSPSPTSPNPTGHSPSSNAAYEAEARQFYSALETEGLQCAFDSFPSPLRTEFAREEALNRLSGDEGGSEELEERWFRERERMRGGRL
ncbi:MAG: hypothetical protein Q9165_007672 [Trypethelium subeluteriae]